MRRPAIFLVVAFALVVTACGRLGLGSQVCEVHVRDPSSANILAAQSVPTAKYTPCFKSVDLGWDGVAFAAETGKTGISVQRSARVFLTAVLTESCELGDAVRAISGYPDIAKYEAIEQVPSDISVGVVGTGPDEVTHGRALATQWGDVTLDERRLAFVIDRDVEATIASRVERALEDHLFVWVIDELDAAEGRLELRMPDGRALSRLSPADAVEFMEDNLPEVVYKGDWFFVFEGGCITYHFDAKGQLAETVAVDANKNLGFYPAYELWDVAQIQGLLGEEAG